MSPGSKKAAKDLYHEQMMWTLYEINIHKQAPDLLHAFRNKHTLSCQILGRIATVYEDGEPYIQGLLADLAGEEMWKQAVGTNEDGHPSVPCPLQYSEAEIHNQTVELAKWNRDVQRKTRVIQELGAYPGWNGAVDHSQYEKISARLARAKERFLGREAETAAARKAWEKVWPFEDKDNSADFCKDS